MYRRERCDELCSARPAVDHSRGVSRVLVHVLSDQMSEADEELGGLGYPVIWPGCEVEVTHGASLRCFNLEDKHAHGLKMVV